MDNHIDASAPAAPDAVSHPIFRRAGTFAVPGEIFRTRPDLVQKLLARTLIFRAEFIFHNGMMEYQAYSMDFEPCEQSASVPRYVIQAEVMHDETTLSFVPYRDGAPVVAAPSRAAG